MSIDLFTYNRYLLERLPSHHSEIRSPALVHVAELVNARCLLDGQVNLVRNRHLEGATLPAFDLLLHSLEHTDSVRVPLLLPLASRPLSFRTRFVCPALLDLLRLCFLLLRLSLALLVQSLRVPRGGVREVDEVCMAVGHCDDELRTQALHRRHACILDGAHAGLDTAAPQRHALHVLLELTRGPVEALLLSLQLHSHTVHPNGTLDSVSDLDHRLEQGRRLSHELLLRDEQLPHLRHVGYDILQDLRERAIVHLRDDMLLKQHLV
mmetsp:Transcript_16932/g.41357  ORF Transcript_16932/g.41357 Transcript_16932/m.41357 type:complete len:266 (-) Transcript_16932:861-1658(-)